MNKDEAYKLMDCLGRLTHDPVAWVYFAFDWDNDPELKGQKPQKWQLEQLERIAKGLETPDSIILAHLMGHFNTPGHKRRRNRQYRSPIKNKNLGGTC